MRTYLLISFAAIVLLNSCNNGQTQTTQTVKTVLPVTEFAEKIKALPNATLIDVRTPSEFEAGHLANAVNYDWKGTEFEKQIAGLDKTQPVFVYCLSGGRSSAAADKMRSEGFTEVYEMEGGITQWRAANLPEVTGSTTNSGQ